ncbi:MAG: transcriptional regulator [Kiritimatiellae bacterium]|nr:transcriptional regulator [Kiritimatiellia bacterium]
MKVPLLDLKTQYVAIKDKVDAALQEVVDSQLFILGSTVQACEQAIASYSQCEYGVGVSSGTDALLISLMAEGVGLDDEVITTPYTFFATAGSIVRLGAKPIFVDIDPVTYNINPHTLEEKITARTKVIMPVHLFGQMADMKLIVSIAEKHNLCIIEDAAQAIGSEYEGQRAGSFGAYGCLSFFPSKNLGAFGDGGMVVTKDSVRAEKLRTLRVHGSNPKYYHQMIGGNFRLDALQAAVVTVKLGYLDAWTTARQQNAKTYTTLFENTGLGSKGLVKTPDILTNRHIFNQYIIRAFQRDKLRSFLKEKEIGTEIYYPGPLHLQKCFSYLGCRQGDFPESEKAEQETLALPVYPELTTEQIEYVVDCIHEFYRSEK